MKTTGGARVAGTQGPESDDRGRRRMRLEKRTCVRRGPSPPTGEMGEWGAHSGLQLQRWAAGGDEPGGDFRDSVQAAWELIS